MFELITVDASFTMSDPKLFKCIPKLIQNGPWGSQNGIIGGQNVPDGAKWILGAPRCAQKEVKVRQDGPKRGPKEPLKSPRGVQGSLRWPRMSPKGADGPKRGPKEPLEIPRGVQGSPRWPCTHAYHESRFTNSFNTRRRVRKSTRQRLLMCK